MDKVFIYDTTLRDGAQGEGVSFSDAGKVRLACILDDLGVDYIEGGFAGSNPRDRKFFKDVSRENLRHARVVAFGSTRRSNMDVKDDPQVKGLLAAETEWVTIYGKSWLLHVTDVLRTDAAGNLRMIADTVGHLQAHGRRVIFDAEHFFDGFKSDSGYAMQALQAAVNEGASAVVLCDTNGGTLPHEAFDITSLVCNRFPGLEVGIHTHNDSGLAVAGALEAVRAGARHVQGTINGYGERTGNANLITILPLLELKMGFKCVGRERLKNLCKVSVVANDLTNQRNDPRQPFVGKASFSHKAGAHVNAVLKNAVTFEHIQPEAVGNQRHILISELSGGANVKMKAAELGVDVTKIGKEQIQAVLAAVKEKENQGYSYESADGSFKILLHKALNQHTPFFELEGFRCIVEKRGPDAPCLSEATIKLKVKGETALTVGEGDGPVDALNQALRKALVRFYPEIDAVMLCDYRVRILDPERATSAVTRVLIESGDGERVWGTVGVSENIIEASWQALLDSVEVKLYECQ
ncbi:MAG: citramalate synthase [Kiritimatiellae bacterium]|nr:citramalate synthase [Kiritimatiellia bacterium]